MYKRRKGLKAFPTFIEEGHRGPVPKRAVGTFVVVDPLPGMGHQLGLPDSIEAVAVEHLLPERPVEPFHVAVLVRLALLDEMNLYPRFTSPFLKRFGNEFRAVVNPDPGGFAPPGDQLLQLADDPIAAQGRVHGDAQTLPVVIVDDVEGSETNPVVQGIMHEIHAPGDVRSDRPQKGLHNPCRQPFLVLATKVQAHLGVAPVHLLVVPVEVLVPKMVMHHPKTPFVVQMGQV